MTHKVSTTPRNNPPNLVPNVPADSDSDTSFLDYSLSDSSDSSDDSYPKEVQHTKNKKAMSEYKYFLRPYQKVRKAYSQATYSHVKIKANRIQIGQGLTTAPDLFTIFMNYPNCFYHNVRRLTFFLCTTHQ